MKLVVNSAVNPSMSMKGENEFEQKKVHLEEIKKIQEKADEMSEQIILEMLENFNSKLPDENLTGISAIMQHRRSPKIVDFNLD